MVKFHAFRGRIVVLQHAVNVPSRKGIGGSNPSHGAKLKLDKQKPYQPSPILVGDSNFSPVSERIEGSER